MQKPPLPKFWIIILSLLMLIFFCILTMINLAAYLGTEDISARDAENWLVAEQKSSDTERKFRCLRGALDIYAYGRVPTIYFNWRYIVAKMAALHKENETLTIAEEPLCEFCMERSMESLALLEQCVASDLISYNNDETPSKPLLGFLLEATEAEMQENHAAYVDKAVDIIIKAIKKGARLSSFSSRHEPMSESELRDKILKIADDELWKAVIENNIIPDPAASSDMTK